MDLGLRGAKVLVAASSEGLGFATARRFSLEEASVVISSRDADKLERAREAIAGETGGATHAVTADMSDPASAQRLADAAAERLGGLDVVVVNAGGPPPGKFEDFDLEAWQRAVNLTLMSAISLIRAALPHLRQSPRAAILTITSTSVRQPVPNLILSNVVRPAVIGLTKSLSLELGPEGIRVNSILPGTIETGRIVSLMNSRAAANSTSPDEERRKAAAEIPLRRIGTPDEFANAAVFLCSPTASYITGVMMPVDGGVLRASM